MIKVWNHNDNFIIFFMKDVVKLYYDIKHAIAKCVLNRPSLCEIYKNATWCAMRIVAYFVYFTQTLSY